MPSPTHDGTAARPKIRFGLILRIGIAVVVILAVVGLISGSHETATVSAVIDNVHRLALAKPAGGPLGPWWVSALSYDAQARRLTDFKMESETLRLSARSARVVANPRTDSVQFEMWNVVVVPVPREGEVSQQNPVEMDRYLLGPIRYDKDIVH